MQKQVRRAFVLMFVFRLLGDLWDLPFYILSGLVKFGQSVSNALLSVEMHFARRYYLLSGFDVGVASGEPHRYRGVRRAEELEEEFERDEE